MKISDAYRILGINENSNKEQVNSAYRKLLLKWHPDKWINSSVEDKKTAEKKFKQITAAKDIIDHPETAEQEVINSNDNFPNGFNDFFGKEENEPQYVPKTDANSRYSFNSGFSKEENNFKYKRNNTNVYQYSEPDKQEKEIANIYNEDLNNYYKSYKDNIKYSFSLLITSILFIIALLFLLNNGNTLNFKNILNNHYVWILCICIIKLISYDFIFPSKIYSFLNKKNLKNSTLQGIELILFSILFFAVSYNNLYMITLFSGVVFIAINLFIRYKEKLKNHIFI